MEEIHLSHWLYIWLMRNVCRGGSLLLYSQYMYATYTEESMEAILPYLTQKEGKETCEYNLIVHIRRTTKVCFVYVWLNLKIGMHIWILAHLKINACRFMPMNLEFMFSKYARTLPDKLSLKEVLDLTNGNRHAYDIAGWLVIIS